MKNGTVVIAPVTALPAISDRCVQFRIIFTSSISYAVNITEVTRTIKTYRSALAQGTITVDKEPAATSFMVTGTLISAIQSPSVRM